MQPLVICVKHISVNSLNFSLSAAAMTDPRLWNRMRMRECSLTTKQMNNCRKRRSYTLKDRLQVEGVQNPFLWTALFSANIWGFIVPFLRLCTRVYKYCILDKRELNTWLGPHVYKRTATQFVREVLFNLTLNLNNLTVFPLPGKHSTVSDFWNFKQLSRVCATPQFANLWPFICVCSTKQHRSPLGRSQKLITWYQVYAKIVKRKKKKNQNPLYLKKSAVRHENAILLNQMGTAYTPTRWGSLLLKRQRKKKKKRRMHPNTWKMATSVDAETALPLLVGKKNKSRVQMYFQYYYFRSNNRFTKSNMQNGAISDQRKPYQFGKSPQTNSIILILKYTLPSFLFETSDTVDYTAMFHTMFTMVNAKGYRV